MEKLTIGCTSQLTKALRTFAEWIVDAIGRMSIGPGQPGSLSLWGYRVPGWWLGMV